MKKLKLSTQLIVLFLSLIFLVVTIFSVTTLFLMQKVAEDQVYIRLESYSKMIQDDRDANHPHQLSDMNVSYIVKRNNTEPFYCNVEDFFEEGEFDSLKAKIIQAREESGNTFPKYTVRGNSITNNGKKIYYVCSVDDNFDSYTFIFTDNTFTNTFIRSTSFRTLSTFLIILLFEVLVIYVWSSQLTHRIQRLQIHIVNMPKNKYEDSYIDGNNDELGDLSLSIEEMRKEIGHNENTKQEMLQNLSHDFKTPIAVIKSYAEAIQDGMAGPEAIDIIIQQSDLLKKKVNRLLQYNSLEYLTKDKPFEEIAMAELIEQVVVTYKYQTELEFKLDLDPNVKFLGYTENWTTVVENIIDNAKRYAKTKIEIVLKNDYLSIYNDGEPINEQFLNSVFKPYEKGSKGQFGLGMSIVKKTIDFFGMNLSVRNEEAGGVTFTIQK